MVRGELFDLALADQIDARIPDVAHHDFVVAQHGDAQGGRHAGLAVVLHALVVHRQVGRVEHLRQQLLWRLILFRGLAKGRQRRLDRQAAGNLATVQPADAIGQHDDSAAAALLLQGLGLPEADVILVVIADRSW